MAKDDLETIIVNFISDQVESAGAGGAVLGLSGGLDSATAAFLAVRALGPERVVSLILPEAGFGDAAADILPIAALYKDEVRALSRRIGVPDRIIEKAPTAGLWPGQTDDVELGFRLSNSAMSTICPLNIPLPIPSYMESTRISLRFQGPHFQLQSPK